MKRTKLLSFLFVSIIIIVMLNQSSITQSTANELDFEAHIFYDTLSLTPHSSIVILNDQDFIDLGLPGNGTFENPYRIENYLIEVPYEKAIEIQFTTKYFVIQNCSILTNDIAIRLLDLSSGTARIENNLIVGDPETHYYGRGIDVSNTDNVTIENNQLDNWRTAILADESDSIRINENNGTRNEVCISVFYSEWSQIVNNNFYDNIDSFFSVVECPHSIIADNQLISNDELDFYVSSSEYSLISNNIIIGSSFEINEGDILDYNTYTLTGNLLNGKLIGFFYGAHDIIIETQVFGCLYLINSYNFVIRNQLFSNVRYPLKLLGCNSFTIEQNSFSICDYPIYIREGYEGIIRNNSIVDGIGGIGVYDHYGSEFYFNLLRNNSNYAMAFDAYTDDNTIHHNYFIENTYNLSPDEPQAMDYGETIYVNTWYDETTKEGNYWSNWQGNCSSYTPYELGGSTYRFDKYPLNEDLKSCSVLSSETSNTNKITFAVPITLLVLFGIVVVKVKRRALLI